MHVNAGDFIASGNFTRISFILQENDVLDIQLFADVATLIVGEIRSIDTRSALFRMYVTVSASVRTVSPAACSRSFDVEDNSQVRLLDEERRSALRVQRKPIQTGDLPNESVAFSRNGRNCPGRLLIGSGVCRRASRDRWRTPGDG